MTDLHLVGNSAAIHALDQAQVVVPPLMDSQLALALGLTYDLAARLQGGGHLQALRLGKHMLMVCQAVGRGIANCCCN
jgi:hypothetical protein